MDVNKIYNIHLLRTTPENINFCCSWRSIWLTFSHFRFKHC